MTPKSHSLPQFPQFTTVHHSNCEHCSHHTTTVVPVGCGECVVETVVPFGREPTVHTFPQSPVENGSSRMKIKSHRTIYAGTMFRSRLEATWAAFFDIEGLPWAYEPVDLEGWVPDFALWLERPVYVEVKPAPMKPVDALQRSAVLDSSFPGFAKAREHASDVDVLLLGIQPNSDADYFGIGTLLDSPNGLPWWPLHDRLTVHGVKVKWGAALAATQWVPQ